MTNTQSSKLIHAAAIVMSSMVLSRITGFVRETLIYTKVGRNWVSDAYVTAFLVPDLMYTLLVGGAISAALIPVFSGYLEKKEEEEGWKAVSTFINLTLIGMVILSILGMIFTRQVIPLVAPGFEDKRPEMKELAVLLTRILFPSVSFIMLAGLCTGILNSYRKFAAAAYGPTIYNIGCSVSIFLFGAYEKDQAAFNMESMQKVAIGVACSAAVYFLFQLFSTLKLIRKYRLVLELRHTGFRKLFRQAVPSILASSIVQVNVMVSQGFISKLSEGGMAGFRSATTAWQLPFGIFATGIGTAILPTLARKYAARELDDFRNILLKSLKSILFLSIPSAIGFIVLREPIIRAIFKWPGKFGESDVKMVAGILMIFSAAMITQSIVATMNRGFYAIEDTRTPLFVGTGTIVLNYILCTLFLTYTKLDVAGMALSYSIISTINSLILMFLLHRKMNGIHLDKFLSFVVRALPASLAMGGALWLLEKIPVTLGSKLAQLGYLALEIGLGALVYIAVMTLVKSEEALYFVQAAKARLKRLKG